MHEASRDQAAREELEEARQFIEHGEISAAIPVLLQTMSKYPESQGATEARYLLGRAYYELNGHRDAISMFKEYLHLAPSGRYAAEASDYIARLTEEYRVKFLSPDSLDARIRELSDQVAQDPAAVEVQWELAEMLWRRGNYSRAAQIYVSVVEEHPQYASNQTFRQRIESLPNGEYIVLTPAELQRREVELQPIQVFNVTGFPAGRDLFTRTRTYYVVTGQVVNRSDSVLYGVEVLVTIYAFGNVIYDTQTVNIGRLNPGEIRAFSVRLTNFEYIENIERYETVATFQR